MTHHKSEKHFKICLVSISLAKGGAERSCAMLSEMLSDSGHEVYLVILNNQIDFPFKGDLFNLGLFKKKQDNFWFRYLRFRKLRKYLVKNSFDVIIDHRPKNNYKRELFYQKYIYRDLPKIYVAHTSKTQQVLTNNLKLFVEIYNMNITNISVSKYIQDKVLKKNGVKKCTTIYNAFDPLWYDEKQNSIPSEIKNKEYILSYGRINDEIKDFAFLINSFNKSMVWQKDKYLVILGDGKDKKKLIDFSETLPCSEKIIFLPFTNTPFPIIKNAKFVTITSKYEGFPMVLAESLSLGTPVVSLDIISGPSEIIIDQQNGLLIGKREVSLFSEGIVTMFEDLNIYNRCKNNAKTSVAEFSKEKISDKWNQLLQNELQ